jgi:hypothetical protein
MATPQDPARTGNLTSFDSLYTHLTSTYNYPILPSPSPYPHDKSLSHSISSLSLHPTLEAILHILNANLPSAHFLCRHMQSKPAWEGMYIHGILHRVEGDYRNAEAWYGDVAESECFKACWPGGLEEARRFISEIERLRKEGVGNKDRLEKESKREIDSLVNWCKETFGMERISDARSAWTEPSEEEREVAKRMIVGGEGWRQF